MREFIEEMLDQQIATNDLVRPSWRGDKLAWHTAVLVECGELIEWTDWKWWKSSDANPLQVQLEVVDIWHFYLSKLAEKADTPQQYAELVDQLFLAFRTEERRSAPRTETLSQLVHMVAAAAAGNKFPLGLFVQLIYTTGLTILSLRDIYIGKAALNAFRQVNGYKEGTYKKQWHGQEDNDWMLDFLMANTAADPDLFDNMGRMLADKYSEVTGGDSNYLLGKNPNLITLVAGIPEGSDSPEPEPAVKKKGINPLG